MSSNHSSYTYTSTSTTSTSSSDSNQPHTHSQTTRASHDDRTGTHAERITQETGQPTLVESTDVPGGSAGGSGGSSGSGGSRRIEDVSEEQAARDREYEERMEEEYAKREGGA